MIRVVLGMEPGIAGAVILGLGRALETMAVTMVLETVPRLALSLFDPSYTVASAIAMSLLRQRRISISAPRKTGLILFLVTFVVNGVARVLVWAITGAAWEEQLDGWA
jgi:phosphate transport system permease protein